MKPHGIRGEVKVRPTSNPSRFCVLKSVYINGKPYRIANMRISGDELFLSFDGVTDRNGAEALRGARIEIDRAAAAPIEPDEFYIADLVDAELYSTAAGGESTHLGTIKRIDSFGAADVFTVSCVDSDKSFSFAFVKALGARFDAESKSVYVDGEKLKEVAVYED